MFTYLAHFSPMCRFPRLFIAIVVCGLMLVACDSFERSVPPFDKTDELVVITVNSPDTYYENAEGGYAGLEFDLASEFARDLGMKVRFKVVPRLDQALLSLEKQGHIAAGLNISAKHELRARFGPVYQRIQPQVAYNTDYPKPKISPN